MILHYSLAILNTNDNALSLLFFANAPMSGFNNRLCKLSLISVVTIHIIYSFSHLLCTSFSYNGQLFSKMCKVMESWQICYIFMPSKCGLVVWNFVIKSPFIFCAYNLSPLHRKSDKHNESNAGCPFASNTHLKIDGAKTTPLNNIFHVVYMI